MAKGLEVLAPRTIGSIFLSAMIAYLAALVFFGNKKRLLESLKFVFGFLLPHYVIISLLLLFIYIKNPILFVFMFLGAPLTYILLEISKSVRVIDRLPSNESVMRGVRVYCITMFITIFVGFILLWLASLPPH